MILLASSSKQPVFNKYVELKRKYQIKPTLSRPWPVSVKHAMKKV